MIVYTLSIFLPTMILNLPILIGLVLLANAQ